MQEDMEDLPLEGFLYRWLFIERGIKRGDGGAQSSIDQLAQCLYSALESVV